MEKGDIVGMVGFFPPLVKQITKLGNKLIIIEKKSNMVKETANWKVTLDPSELKECTKVLITSTTVLNNTLDDILINCAKAKQISVIGPSAGYFPDPLFSKGVNVIGGTYITNPEVFIDLFKNNEKWGPATKKYAIDRKDYPGYKSILQMISDN